MSSIEDVFPGGCLPFIKKNRFFLAFHDFTYNCYKVILANFKSSAIEVVYSGGYFHISKMLKIILSSPIVLSSTILQSKLSWFPGYSLLVWVNKPHNYGNMDEHSFTKSSILLCWAELVISSLISILACSIWHLMH